MNVSWPVLIVADRNDRLCDIALRLAGAMTVAAKFQELIERMKNGEINECKASQIAALPNLFRFNTILIV